jgi:hypothetical protein
MEKRKNKKSNFVIPFGTVRDLPPGRGAGVVSLKKGKIVEIKHGRVITIKTQKQEDEITVLKQFSKTGNNAFTKTGAFGAGTKVLAWEQDEQCMFCAMSSCNGICPDI